MRLSKNEVRHIKESVLTIYGDKSRVFLFGSRVDDNQKGGDIDLYLIPANKDPESSSYGKKIEFLVLLKEKIGEQKIDLVIARDSERLIEREAIAKGIEL